MAISKRKQKFWDVEIPIIQKTTYLYAFEPEELDGKTLIYDLTRILRGKGTLLTAKVKVNEKEVTTIPKEVRILPYFLRRMVRKGTDYVEDSFVLECKDAKLIIKPLLVTRRKVSRRIKNALREKAKKELAEYLKENSSEDIFREILQGKLQKILSAKLKKIYPLSVFEIKTIRVESQKEIIQSEIKKTKKKKQEPVQENENSETGENTETQE